MAEQETIVKKTSSKNKLIIIYLTAIVLLLTAGIVVYFLFTPNLLLKTIRQGPVTKMVNPVVDKMTPIGPMVDLSEFIVNLTSEDFARYVKASMTIELSNKNAAEEAEKRMAQIRDAILLLISSKTFAELHDLQGKKQLKAEIKSKLNSFLRSGRVRNVYFTDFVVQ